MKITAGMLSRYVINYDKNFVKAVSKARKSHRAIVSYLQSKGYVFRVSAKRVKARAIGNEKQQKRAKAKEIKQDNAHLLYDDIAVEYQEGERYNRWRIRFKITNAALLSNAMTGYPLSKIPYTNMMYTVIWIKEGEYIARNSPLVTKSKRDLIDDYLSKMLYNRPKLYQGADSKMPRSISLFAGEIYSRSPFGKPIEKTKQNTKTPRKKIIEKRTNKKASIRHRNKE